MISGVYYLERDSLGLWWGKMGYKKKINSFMLSFPENSLLFKIYYNYTYICFKTYKNHKIE